MRGPNFLEKNYIDFLVTNISPGVFGFINYGEKKIWISYTENISEAVVRNINLIENRQHKIKKIEGWDICVFGRTDNKQLAKNQFRVICKKYKEKGLQILNKEFNYKVWGSIEKSFKNPDEFLYYIWVGTRNVKLGLLGVFQNAAEGQKALKDFKAGQLKEFPISSKRLVIEYKQLDKEEFKRLFG